MDTSETYIKMCEKAEEIQQGWQPQGGDCFYIIDGDFSFGEPAEGGAIYSKGDIIFSSSYEYPCQREENHKYYHNLYIWLPRQDQLQEMVSGEPYETMIYGNIKINETSDFISLLPNILLFAYDWDYGGDNITLTYKQPYQSTEQLWLAFVMKEKFNKTWDGDKWQK